MRVEKPDPFKRPACPGCGGPLSPFPHAGGLKCDDCKIGWSATALATKYYDPELVSVFDHEHGDALLQSHRLDVVLAVQGETVTLVKNRFGPSGPMERGTPDVEAFVSALLRLAEKGGDE